VETRQEPLLNFELTDDHRLLQQSVREWAAREVAPRIRELDRAHRFDPPIAHRSLQRAGVHDSPSSRR
jgi:alkylation response protein AidB-like acyl-CoA dehydrogenase